MPTSKGSWARVVLACSLALTAVPVSQASARGGIRWTDVRPGGSGYWARAAIHYVARSHDWMRDFGPRRFEPDRIESKKLLARAVVRAFAPTAVPHRSMRFRDLPASDPFFRYANVAVGLGWMSTRHHRFHPDSSVTEKRLFSTLARALRLRAQVAGANRMHTTDGYRFKHHRALGALLIGTVLGLRYNHDAERLDVLPSTPLVRAEVAWSLYRAATLPRAEIESRTDGYANLHLGPVPAGFRKVVEFGMRYVGFPYVYGGEWPRGSRAGYCCGPQPVGGFDCSGLMWWLVKRSDGAYRVPWSIRPYTGWMLRPRTSHDMATAIPRARRLRFRGLRAGDLAFYDGDRDGVVDHVDLYLGFGWALDSSTGSGGVAIIRVATGWYRAHFAWGRSIV